MAGGEAENSGQNQAQPMSVQRAMYSMEMYSAGTIISDWLERMEEIFLLNETALDRAKVSFLLTHLGADGYETIKALCAPAKPNSLSFENLSKKLIEHFDPQPTPLAERYKFYRLNQGKDTVPQWRARLSQASTKCKFGNYRDTAIRDQFIFGLANEKTRILLMSDEEVELDAAYKNKLQTRTGCFSGRGR